MNVSFFYNAQLHQIPHSLPIAFELATRHRDFQVDIAGVSPRHLDFVRDLAARCGVDAPLRYVLLPRPWWVKLRARASGALAPNKKSTLRANLDYFASRDALVTPEWTSVFLRRAGLPARTRMIFTGHGAGDRSVTLHPSIADFDFVLVPGAKLEQRMLEHRVIRPGAYATGVYAKFDLAQRRGLQAQRWFDNDRPTVLYNPHFARELSSWPLAGRKLLDHFAASTRYNLIFAPHVRLYEPPTAANYRRFRDYTALPHIHVDLGSERCIDMSYTIAADAYIGDVSSQVAEFLVRPRPCLFLNPRRTVWQDDPNYRFWTLGPVLDDIGQLDAGVREMFASHEHYREPQQRYFDDSFDGAGREPSAARGADAIAAFLHGGS